MIDPVKLSSHGLITMQNLVALCHVCAYVGGPQHLGTLGLNPLERSMADP